MAKRRRTTRLPPVGQYVPKLPVTHKATELHAACRTRRNGRKCDAINPARRARYHCLPCSEYVQDPTTPINSMRCLFPHPLPTCHRTNHRAYRLDAYRLHAYRLHAYRLHAYITYRLHASPAGAQPILPTCAFQPFSPLARHPIPTLAPRRTQNPNIAEPLPMGCLFSASSATASIRPMSLPPHPQAPTLSSRPSSSSSSSSPETRDVIRTTTKPACLGGHCSQGIPRASQTLLFVRVGCRWTSANP